MQHSFHPVANVFPLMLESELAELAEDIKANGLREPIWLDGDGKVIDGRNRYLACQRAGVEPTFRTYEGDDPITFAVSMNLKRRHLSESQLGMIGAEVAKLRHGTNRFTKVEGDVSPSTPTLAEAAAMVGVSRDTVKNGKTVLMQGTPEEIEAVKAGAVAVGTLAKDIRRGVPPEQRGKNKPKSHRNTWTQVAIPEGMTLEDHARNGLRLQAEGKTADEIRKALGVGNSTWIAMRNVVLIADREDLSERERKIAQTALAEMNATGQTAAAHEMVAPIVRRIWGDSDSRRTKPDRAEELRVEAFERAYGVIVHACMGASLIEVPHLSKERATELAAELQSAIGSVRALRQRILEIHQ